MADAIQRIASDLGVPYIFKASYDKANRTSIHSFRGPGLVEGCRILRAIAESTGLPVLTDVHTPAGLQASRPRQSTCCRSPPSSAARPTCSSPPPQTGRAINIKKGQFVAPWDMRHAVDKIRECGNQRVSLTERGASFGYNNLVVDMRALPIMRAFAPVVFDGTHSVQTPSAANGVSGGQPEFIPVLTRAAVAAGVDGIFLEVHDDPAEAKSDGANALHLNKLKAFWNSSSQSTGRRTVSICKRCSPVISAWFVPGELRYKLPTKNGPSLEGPICLGSLWLGEFFASVIFVADSANLRAAQRHSRHAALWGRATALGGALTPDVVWEVPGVVGATLLAEFELIVARLLCNSVT